MEDVTSSRLARRAAPYGLAVLPEKNQCESTDPANEVAITQRWQSVCEQHGAVVLGVRDVPTARVRMELDGIPWHLEPLGAGERAVPAKVFHRWRALEAVGVPFLYWLWGEEQVVHPNLRPTTWSSRPTNERDPLVIGVIPTASHRGV